MQLQNFTQNDAKKRRNLMTLYMENFMYVGAAMNVAHP